ncbi:hypothetical protein [Candidatus Palauibacter sp.]|uniref:hypothetical protein n=1 Tax=Candidatus Palauibacter sp. TaxID=3101350 RepID=UPI003AF2FFF2
MKSRAHFGIAGAMLVASFVAVVPAHARVRENLGLVNPNLATEQQLAGVPGLDADAVAAIMEARPFLRMADLHTVVAGHVPGEGYESVYRAMFVPIDLNDVSDEEILLIPGVGNRMLHEFEEYRPYVALPQFHREIGKYVDDDELARLAQYVYVRIDLNTATEEAILGIPGVGARTQHEFEEYRPYASMAQFRREIGKYVDEDEVERLARYVEIR